MFRGASLALLGLVVGTSAAAMDITTCRQFVPAGVVAVLQADLVCGPSAQWPFSPQGVVLNSGATVSLNGHSITGDGTGVGVDCEPQGGIRSRRNACRVVGPGVISGFELGIGVVGHVAVEGVTVRGNRYGISVAKCCQLDVADVVAEDNATAGVYARRLSGSGLRANRNGEVGVWAYGFNLVGLSASGNGLGGGVRGRGRLIDSVVVDNGGFDGTYDLLAFPRIRTRRSTCGGGIRLRSVLVGSDYETRVIGRFACR